MKNQYILMNKEENRILLAEAYLNTLSGEIGNNFVRSFNPRMFKSKFSALTYSWLHFSNCKAIPVTFKDSVKMPNTAYIWLKFKDSSRSSSVIKVYREDFKMAPSNSSKIYHTGRVMIKGVGDFMWSDFVEFSF